MTAAQTVFEKSQLRVKKADGTYTVAIPSRRLPNPTDPWFELEIKIGDAPKAIATEHKEDRRHGLIMVWFSGSFLVVIHGQPGWKPVGTTFDTSADDRWCGSSAANVLKEHPLPAELKEFAAHHHIVD